MDIRYPCQRVSYASWRLHALSRVFFSLDPSNSITHRSISTSLRKQKEQTENASDRKRRPSDRLPRSPIIARKARTAQMRQKQPNPTTPREPDPLRHNAWARILASPPRMCRVTHARMPADLMVDFGLVKYPEASSYWLMPTKLLKEDLRDLELKQAADDEAGGRQSRSSKEPPPKSSVTGSAKILDALTVVKPINFSKLFREKSKAPDGPLAKPIMANMVWRQDMADFVLQQLRRKATKTMKTSSMSNASPKVTPESWMVLDVNGTPGVEQLEQALEKLGDMENKSWGAVLVLGPRSGNQDLNETKEPDVQNNRSSTDDRTTLPDLIKLPGANSTVPIFDLRALLSKENIRDLQGHHPVFRNDALFFRAIKHINSDPLVALMQLKGYVSDGEDFST